MAESRAALVVGGAGGIGEAVCVRLAKEGHRVVVADLNMNAAGQVCARLPGVGHVSERIDVTDEADVDAFFERCETREPAAILVNIAGGPLVDPTSPPTLTTMSLGEWNATLALNLTGTFLCLRKFAAVRKARPVELMRAISFSSVTGRVPGGPTGIAYGTAKAAIIGFTRHAAAELAPVGITVNSIAPGAVGTPEFFRIMSDEAVKSVASLVPIGRVGSTEEVAGAVAYLVSQDAGYVTGATIDVNGGYFMY